MECRPDLDRLERKTRPFEVGASGRDAGLGSREHRLRRRVVVRHPDICHACDGAFDRRALRAHRRHRSEIAAGRGLDHEAAAGFGYDQKLFERHDAGGVERDELAIAVARRHVGAQAKPRQTASNPASIAPSAGWAISVRVKCSAAAPRAASS